MGNTAEQTMKNREMEKGRERERFHKKFKCWTFEMDIYAGRRISVADYS